MALIPCAACQRHVYTTETICPFCQHELATLDVTGRRRAPSARMSRAALVLLGMSGVACEQEPVPVAIYGSPPTGAGGVTSSAGGNGHTSGEGQGGTAGEVSDAGGAAGEPIDSGLGGTASPSGTGGGAVPVYGAPPAPER